MDPVLRVEATQGAWDWGCGVRRGDRVAGGHWWLLAQGHAALAKHHTRHIRFPSQKTPVCSGRVFPRPGGGWSEEVGVMTLYLKCPGQN